MCARSKRDSLSQLSMEGMGALENQRLFSHTRAVQPSKTQPLCIFLKQCQGSTTQYREEGRKRKKSKTKIKLTNLSLKTLSTFTKALLPDDAIIFVPAVLQWLCSQVPQGTK